REEEAVTMPMRTDYCGLLRASDTGRTVTLCGWVDRRREHGEHLAFIDVRDHTGITQCVVDGAHDLRSEYVVKVEGTVRVRPEGTTNANIPTGEIELGDCTVEVLSTAEPPPFPLDERVQQTDEVTRLRYRYVDLRRDRMQRSLRDEDLRADRQFEFIQLDAEASFVTQDDVIRFISEAVAAATEAVTGERPGDMPEMSWEEAAERFGSDKPDIRFGLELQELTD